MTRHKTRAVVVDSSASDFEVIRQELAAREFGEVLQAARPGEARKAAKNDALALAVVSVASSDGGAVELIEAMRRERPELQIIATGPAPTPELILQAVRAGAVEFLVQPIQSAEFAQALDRVLQTRDRVLQAQTSPTQPGRCVAVYSAKGGVGATTVSVNLAFALARLDPTGRVALVDLAVQGGDVRVLLDIKGGTRTIADLSEKVEQLNTHSLERFLHECPGGVWVCLDPNLPDEGELIDGHRIGAVVGSLARTFAYTVIDCEHSLNDRTLAVLDLADAIVLLTNLTVPAVTSLKRTLAVFARLGYPTEKIDVVVNRYGSRSDLTLPDLEKVIGRPVAGTVANDYRATSSASARGRPIHEVARGSKIPPALDRLAARLNGGVTRAARRRWKLSLKSLRLFRRAAEV